MDRIRQKRNSGRSTITPSPFYAKTKIVDATPGIIGKHALTSKQALLAKLRYNRLLDILMGFSCYSLQTNVKTTLTGYDQVLFDEIYLGIDERGEHCVLPVLCARPAGKIKITQIELCFVSCAVKFPKLTCHSIAAQFMNETQVALFVFERDSEGPRAFSQKHFQLIRPEHLPPEAWDAHYKAIFN